MASTMLAWAMISLFWKVWIWNLLSVISATALASTSAGLKNSTVFGKPEVRRHFTSGAVGASAGAASADIAAPPAASPAFLINERRSMVFFLHSKSGPTLVL